MAYASKDLSVLAYANGFTLWHYTTADAADDVDAAGYFNGASDLLRTGDMLLANCAAGGPPVAGLLVVAANAGGVVGIAALTPLGTPGG
ncbi:hypothetical protein [Azospirillum picis]|uniref:Uncharacterized protein n=1 Tax=Azospirillum picis TaxID=488438 RepID=A0ABU0MPM3_9PROT|nr:hypothetical protein [Azospirillum picis]MBP2301586.1 hypothetical protein [Azospirillum picis]MDQ0535418.1 hypothetical protein [Azospirillum picis]